MDMRLLSYALLIAAVVLWCASLFQPGLKAPGTGTFQYSGMYCLLAGWIGAFGRPLWVLPWSANVLFWISVPSGIFRRPAGRHALMLSVIAIPLALVTLAIRSIEMNEGGDKTAVAPGAGFYLWLTSLVMLAAGQAVRMARPW
jgi:hypothetical protein